MVNILSIVSILILIIIPVTVVVVYIAVVKNIPLSVLLLALIAAALGFFDFDLGVCAALAFVFISIAMSFVIKKKLSTHDGLLLTILSYGLSLFLIVMYLAFIASQDISHDIRSFVDIPVALLESNGFFEVSELFGFPQEFYRAWLEMAIASLVPIYCLVCGFISYYRARNLAARKSFIKPLRFSDLDLPRNVATGLMIMMIASLLCYYIDIPNAGFISNVLMTCAITVFSINGLALLSFMLSAKIKSVFLRGLIMAAAVIIFFGQWLLAVFGILGQMLRIRERLNNKKPS